MKTAVTLSIRSKLTLMVMATVGAALCLAIVALVVFDQLSFSARLQQDAVEVGARRPLPTPVPELGPGDVGYLIAGIKDVGQARSGETVTTLHHGATVALDGYRDPKPMVFCGLFPIDGDDFELLRESIEKLKLNFHLDDVVDVFRKVMLRYQGKLVSMPYDGDIHIMYWNRPAFERADNQKKFKAKYGYDLTFEHE